jgi:hypothetical protein
MKRRRWMWRRWMWRRWMWRRWMWRAFIRRDLHQHVCVITLLHFSQRRQSQPVFHTLQAPFDPSNPLLDGLVHPSILVWSLSYCTLT